MSILGVQPLAARLILSARLSLQSKYTGLKAIVFRITVFFNKDISAYNT